MQKPMAFQMSVPLSPEWRDIELLRTSVLNCVKIVFREHEFSSAIGMITGELLENALKYGDWSRGHDAPFRLHVYGDRESVTIEVSNPVARDNASVARLFETVRWIRSAGDPQTAFMQRVAEVAARPPDLAQASSGLGLARIAYEGNCDLDAALEDGVVLLRAVTRP
jgi:hypothetical protein